MRHTMRFFTLALVAILLLGITPPAAGAAPLPQSELDAIYGGWVHYKVPGTNNAASCQSNGTLTGTDNANKAYNYAQEELKLQPHQAAGIVGNLMAESSVMPNRKQGAGIQTINSVSQIVPNVGFGIAQWTSPGRQAEWKNLGEKEAEKQLPKGATSAERQKLIDSVTLSLELELQYLSQELNTNPGYGLAELKAAADLRQATWIFLAFFERPATIVDAGLAANPNAPTKGPASDTLFARIKLAEKISGSGSLSGEVSSGSSCVGANLVNNINTPNYKANPRIAVEEANVEGKCTEDFTEGAQSLKALIEQNWKPPVQSIGGYSCREIVGGDGQLSLHAVGRALDIMISAENPRTLEVGDKIRNFLINNSEALQVQRVIWNCNIWSADQDGWRPYCTEPGRNPHTDHLHVEINTKGAKNSNLAGGV